VILDLGHESLVKQLDKIIVELPNYFVFVRSVELKRMVLRLLLHVLKDQVSWSVVLECILAQQVDVCLIVTQIFLVLHLPVYYGALLALKLNLVLALDDVQSGLRVAKQVKELMREDVALLHIFDQCLLFEHLVLHLLGHELGLLRLRCDSGLEGFRLMLQLLGKLYLLLFGLSYRATHCFAGSCLIVRSRVDLHLETLLVLVTL